jgi:hypothetical protein
VGRDIAKDPGFSYSPALQQGGGRWSFNEIYEWIGDPGELVQGNKKYKMGFAGLKDPQSGRTSSLSWPRRVTARSPFQNQGGNAPVNRTL